MACEHHYVASNHDGYLLCAFCKSYRSLKAVPPETLYGPDYWTHEAGHSTLKEQAYNLDEFIVNGSSKCQFVLDRIEVEDRSAALEIGCAPGRMLLLLRGIGRFQDVVGIEACPLYVEDIREIGCFGGGLLIGLFPEVTYGLDMTFTYICALDVWEHSWQPEEFVRECYRLLDPGGQLFMMMPLNSPDLEERFFAADEHVWIFSRGYTEGLLQEVGFEKIQFDHWTNGHDTVSARRPL